MRVIVQVCLLHAAAVAASATTFGVVGTSGTPLQDLALKDARRYLSLLSGGNKPAMHKVTFNKLKFHILAVMCCSCRCLTEKKASSK